MDWMLILMVNCKLSMVHFISTMLNVNFIAQCDKLLIPLHILVE